jgi:hypothetical protein
MKRRLSALGFGLIALASTAGAQRPSFAGDWVRNDSVARTVATAGDAAFRRGDMSSGWGATLTIRERPDSMIVEYDFFSAYDLQPRVRLAYALDGSESRNSIMIGHAESAQRARLSWQDNALVITTQHVGPKGADGRAPSYEVRQALTLDASGALVVETTRSGVLGAPTTTTRAQYGRK